MREIKFKIEESIKNELQALAIETESRQSLIAFMLTHDMVNNSNFEKYQNEYKNYYAQYEFAKTKFQKMVVNPVLQENGIDTRHASWSLDFEDSEVTVTIAE